MLNILRILFRLIRKETCSNKNSDTCSDIMCFGGCLIAPLIDANPVVSNRLVGKCKNSNETTYVFNENGIQYYYNLHTLVINAFSDDFKDATFDRIHLSESDLQ